MMKRMIGLLLALALILLGIGGCAPKEENQELKEIRLMLDWTPSTNHTGIYMAQALGYYEQAGLKVTILQPPESGPLPVLASGKAEYAISFQEELGPALALAQPYQVTAIAGIISHNTSGIISLKDKNITRPRDLEGKRLVVWDTPLVAAIVKDIVERDGGNFSNVQMEFNNVGDVITALETNADAIWIYFGWDGAAVELTGMEYNYFPIAEYNPIFDYHTPILVVNDAYRLANPDEVKAFMEATSKGYQYAMEHPEEAAKKYLELVPELDYHIVLEGQEYLAKQYQGDAVRWGEIDSVRWNKFYDWMYQQGLLDYKLNQDQGFTNKYLP